MTALTRFPGPLEGRPLGASILPASAYTDPARFHAEYERDYRVQQHFSSVAMISPVEGTLRGYRHLETLKGVRRCSRTRGCGAGSSTGCPSPARRTR